MKLATLFGAISIPFLTKVLAVPTETNVDINDVLNENEENGVMKEIDVYITDENYKVVEVENNSYINVHIKNANEICEKNESSNCNWFLISDATDDYKFLKLLKSTDNEEKSMRTFKFKVENLTLSDVLPNLEFIYGRPGYYPGYSRAVLHLANPGQIDLVFDDIYYMLDESGRKDLVVKRNSIVQIQLNKICPSTGYDYYWYLEKSSLYFQDKNIEKINIDDNGRTQDKIMSSQKYRSVTGCYDEVFKFRIKENADDSLPTLTFTHDAKKTFYGFTHAYVTLRLSEEDEEEKEPLKEIDINYDSETSVYEIEEGSYFLNIHVKNLSKEECLSLRNDSIKSDECKWRFKDDDIYDDYVKKSYKFLDYRGRTYDRKKDTFVFKFKVENFKSSDVFPNLFFYYGPVYNDRPALFPEGHVKFFFLHFTLPGQIEVFFDDVNSYIAEPGRKEITVKKNSIVQIQLDRTCGVYDWLNDSNEINQSNVTESIGQGYYIMEPFWEKLCYDSVFKYRIKETATADTLPVLKFVQVLRGSFKTDDRAHVELVLKLKEDDDYTDCPVKDYRCCSNANAEILYSDTQGNWSIENNQWCFLVEKEEPKDECMKNLGYPCCKTTQTVVYTDEVGSWGIENSGWCAMKVSMDTCQSVDGYPLCKKTKEIVYTDTSYWGVENNQWCIICK